ncbi:Uncharacterised protein [Mycobacteroides abscessus subsp. abscessus]|nr:Uncharacterised protein [Mycobacteroides abscessus subsp. abscessus]
MACVIARSADGHAACSRFAWVERPSLSVIIRAAAELVCVTWLSVLMMAIPRSQASIALTSELASRVMVISCAWVRRASCR